MKFTKIIQYFIINGICNGFVNQISFEGMVKKFHLLTLLHNNNNNKFTSEFSDRSFTAKNSIRIVTCFACIAFLEFFKIFQNFFTEIVIGILGEYCAKNV